MVRCGWVLNMFCKQIWVAGPDPPDVGYERKRGARVTTRHLARATGEWDCHHLRHGSKEWVWAAVDPEWSLGCADSKVPVRNLRKLGRSLELGRRVHGDVSSWESSRADAAPDLGETARGCQSSGSGWRRGTGLDLGLPTLQGQGGSRGSR